MVFRTFTLGLGSLFLLIVFGLSSASGQIGGAVQSQTKTAPLSLKDAIRLALENNVNIEVSKGDRKIANNRLRSLLGGYDPVLTSTPRYTNNKQPQTSTLGGADLSGVTRSKEFRFDTNVRTGVQATGGDLTVSFNNGKNTTSSRFSQLNPTFSSTLGISYNQPLFKNFAIDAQRQQIRIQRKRIDQSDSDLAKTVSDVVTQVQRAYWDLVFALRDVQNKTANLNLAKESLRITEARINAGSAAPLQKAEIETELSNRESDLIAANQQVIVAENALRNLLSSGPQSDLWTARIVPTDRPTPPGTDSVDEAAAIRDAVANRPELVRLRHQVAIADINRQYAQNQTRPQVDLSSSYNLIGLSGTLVGAAGSVPSQFIGGYGQSLSNLGDGKTRSLVFGLTIGLPIGNRSAKADLATAEVQTSQAVAQVRLQEQTVVAEVRNAVAGLESSRQRLVAARRGRESAEIQLEGERKLLDVGRSTQFLLFQRENSLANARNAEIRAETDYSKALAELQRATATVMSKNNIDLGTNK